MPTASGSIDLAGTGGALAHEHGFVLGEEYRDNYKDDGDEEITDCPKAVSDLNELHWPDGPRSWTLCPVYQEDRRSASTEYRGRHRSLYVQ
jgi:hypothetical protein